VRGARSQDESAALQHALTHTHTHMSGIGTVIRNTRDIEESRSPGRFAPPAPPTANAAGPPSPSLPPPDRPASFFFLAPAVPRGTLNLSCAVHAISRGRGTSAIERATYPRSLLFSPSPHLHPASPVPVYRSGAPFLLRASPRALTRLDPTVCNGYRG